MNKISIIYYINSNGNRPVKEFIDSLNSKQQAKIIRIVQYIKEYGLQSVIPHLKKFSNSPFWEIRILGKTNIRILYVVEYQNTILVLHGFIKKTQRTDKRDINIALKRYSDWKKRGSFDK